MRAKTGVAATIALLLLVLSARAQNLGQGNGTIHIFRGVLEDTSGAPLPGVYLHLLNWSGEEVATTVTGAGGSFSFSNAGPGLYQLTGTFQGVPFDEEVNSTGAPVMNEVRLEGVSVSRRRSPSGGTVSVAALEAPPAAHNDLRKAQEALAKHQISKAMDLSARAAAKAPHWAKPRFFRGVINLSQRLYVEAIREFGMALREQPHDAMALAAMGSAYRQLGQDQVAMQYLNWASREAPIWQTYFTRAQVELHMRRSEQAIADANHALELADPGPPECYLLRANGDIQLRRYQDAESAIQDFLQLAPSAPEAGEARKTLAQLRRVLARTTPTRASR